MIRSSYDSRKGLLPMSIRQGIIAYFDRHVGQIVNIDDIVNELGLELRQAQGNIANIRNSDNGPLDWKASIQVVTHGRQYLYRPVPKADPATSLVRTKRCFEEIGPTKDGSVLIQADDGTIWKAVEL